MTVSPSALPRRKPDYHTLTTAGASGVGGRGRSGLFVPTGSLGRPVLGPLSSFSLSTTLVAASLLGMAFWPILLSLGVASYLLAWIAYLVYAQTDNPRVSPNSLLPYLPYNPYRVLALDYLILQHSYAVLLGPIRHGAIWLLSKLAEETRSKKLAICTNIHYGSTSTSSTLDVYCAHPSYPVRIDRASMSTEQTVGQYRLRPVIIFVFGGMWRQGEKRIYTPVAQMAQGIGCVAVMINYDLYPKGKIDSMVADIHAAIIWTHDHIRQFGGDPSRIYLLAHESGAHVVTLTLLHDAVVRRRRDAERAGLHTPGPQTGAAAQGNGHAHPHSHSHSHSNGHTPSSPGQHAAQGFGFMANMGRGRGLREPGVELPRVEGVVLVAGIFDLPSHYEHEVNRGFDEVSCLKRINGDPLSTTSPLHILRTLPPHYVRSVLPHRWWLHHGTADSFVLPSQSRTFAQQLRRAGVRVVEEVEWEGVDHVGLISALTFPTSPLAPTFVAGLKAFCQVKPRQPDRRFSVASDESESSLAGSWRETDKTAVKS